MAIRPLSELDDTQLVNSDQDCRGWPVVDATGNQIGRVDEMLVDTDVHRVTSLRLDGGEVIPVGTVSLRDGKVRATGASSGPASAQPMGGAHSAASGSTVGAGDEVVLPVIEEEIRVGKREVESGGVRVTTRVEERPVQQTVSLREERVDVSRRPVDRAVANADEAFQERSFEVDASSEEAVVDKRARVVEEVVVKKDVRERDAVIDEKVKRTDVDVTEIAAARKDSSRPS